MLGRLDTIEVISLPETVAQALIEKYSNQEVRFYEADEIVDAPTTTRFYSINGDEKYERAMLVYDVAAKYAKENDISIMSREDYIDLFEPIEQFKKFIGMIVGGTSYKFTQNEYNKFMGIYKLYVKSFV